MLQCVVVNPAAPRGVELPTLPSEVTLGSSALTLRSKQKVAPKASRGSSAAFLCRGTKELPPDFSIAVDVKPSAGSQRLFFNRHPFVPRTRIGDSLHNAHVANAVFKIWMRPHAPL